MTVLQLNADIYRNLGVIAEDELALTKVANYVRRVVKQMTVKSHDEEAISPALLRQIEIARQESERGETIVCLA